MTEIVQFVVHTLSVTSSCT